MDNIILIASGVLISGLIILIWTIIKIKQFDSVEQTHDGEEDFTEDSLIKLAPPKLVLGKNGNNNDIPQEIKKEPVYPPASFERSGAGPAGSESMANLEKKIESIESSLKSLYNLIAESQKNANDVALNELKGLMQDVASKVNSIMAGQSKNTGGTDNSGVLNEVLNSVKQLSSKMKDLEASAGQPGGIGLNLLGEGAGNDILLQKMEEIKQLYSGLKDGEEEILSQIINKLDILNRIITSHITKT
mgnify:CR=1 FL=1